MSESKKPPPVFPRPPPPPVPSTTHCNYCGKEVNDVTGRVHRVKRLNGDDYVWHYRCWEEVITMAVLPIYEEEDDQIDG